MPRKPFKEQAGYQYTARSRSYLSNHILKDIKGQAEEGDPRYIVLRRVGLIVRNPDMKPLLHRGKKL